MTQKRLVEIEKGQDFQKFAQSLSSLKLGSETFYLPSWNSKLGTIWNWSLPWIATCPGRSPLCKKWCYVVNRNPAPNVQRVWQNNLDASRRPDFASCIIQYLRRQERRWRQGPSWQMHLLDFTEHSIADLARLVRHHYATCHQQFSKVLRFHPSGDFYSVQYIQAWIRISEALPDWRFFGYTRSWAVPALEPTLKRLAVRPNVTLYASLDRSMPPPEGWDLHAWMSYSHPPEKGVWCPLERVIKKLAFDEWKWQEGKPASWQKRPPKMELLAIAQKRGIKPLYCQDCGICIKGERHVWFKMRSNPYQLVRGRWIPRF